MTLSPKQHQRVLDSIASGRLRLDTPLKMYAGHGDGKPCDGCGEAIGDTQVEHEAVYHDGQAYHLHIACAALWYAERQRRLDAASIEETREQGRAIREAARITSKESARLQDHADVLAREAEAVIEESRRVKRGEGTG